MHTLWRCAPTPYSSRVHNFYLTKDHNNINTILANNYYCIYHPICNKLDVLESSYRSSSRYTFDCYINWTLLCPSFASFKNINIADFRIFSLVHPLTLTICLISGMLVFRQICWQYCLGKSTFLVWTLFIHLVPVICRSSICVHIRVLYSQTNRQK